MKALRHDPAAPERWASGMPASAMPPWSAQHSSARFIQASSRWEHLRAAPALQRTVTAQREDFRSRSSPGPTYGQVLALRPDRTGFPFLARSTALTISRRTTVE